jgi:hypothetical protein
VLEAEEGFTGYNTRILLANRSDLSCAVVCGAGPYPCDGGSLKECGGGSRDNQS